MNIFNWLQNIIKMIKSLERKDTIKKMQNINQVDNSNLIKEFIEQVPCSTIIKEFLSKVEPQVLEIYLTKIRMFNQMGVFYPLKDIAPDIKSMIAQGYAYGEWPRIALDVSTQYMSNPGGDYFEFGSEGLNTLCNFLTAFHLNGNDKRFPSMRFFAFDIFGDPQPRSEMGLEEEVYFKAHTYRSSFSSYYEEMKAKLREFGLMEDRVELIKGYFSETLSDQFKTRLRKEKRSIGFAFLDCNIPSSYKTALNFVEEFIHPDHSWIYLDEYFQCPEVPAIFNQFCRHVEERYQLKPFYVRTAGSFGALFKMMKQCATVI